MVYVYLTDIAELPDPKGQPELLELLTPDRRCKIEKQQQAEKRKQSLGAGLLIKEILTRHGVLSEFIRLGSRGKPEADGIFFNLSHSGELVVCAVSDCPVGCDVEKIKPIHERLIQRYFSEAECQHLGRFAESQRAEEFIRLWTLKESYMKMTGEGIYLPLKAFELCLGDKVTVCRNGEAQSCVFKEYEVPGYKFSVCSETSKFTDITQIDLQINN